MSFPGTGNFRGGGNLRGPLGFSANTLGPRGGGAGAIRILLQFITQYDRGRLESLAGDLKRLEAERIKAQANLEAATKKVEQAEIRQKRNKEAIKKIDELFQPMLEQIRKTQDQINDRVDRHLSVTKQRNLLEQQVNQLYNTGLEYQVQQGTMTRTQANAIRSILLNENQVTQQKANQARLAANLLAIEEQINNTQRERQSIQQVLSQAAASLRGLVLGAAGAVIGGAVIGAVLFDPLQKATEQMKAAIGDLMGGAAGAKEVVSDLADEVTRIASEKNISNLAAAAQLLERIGAPKELAPQLAQAPRIQALQEQVDLLTKTGQFLVGQKQLEQDLTKEASLRSAVIGLQNRGLEDQARLLQAALDIQKIPGVDVFEKQYNWLFKLLPGMDKYTDLWDYIAHLFGSELPPAIEDTTDALQRAADAWADFNQEAAQGAIDMAVDAQVSRYKTMQDVIIANAKATYDATVARLNNQAEADIQAVSDAADARIARIQKQIDAIGNRGPSSTTQQLSDQINALNAAEERRQYLSSLADIDEQRHLILLRQRLALTNEDIDLTKYQGKEKLAAIDALLARMREQNEAQDRFNKLLDLQYQISQGVRRQQGETIQEFIQRRAQYYRGLLEQAAQLTRQGPQAELQAERDKTQTIIELQQLQERRTQIVRDRARTLYLRDLQERLRASQEADRRAAEAERKRLQERIQRIREHTQQQITEINKTRDADIRAAASARDAAIREANFRYGTIIKNLEDQRTATKFWTDKTETDRLGILIDSAKNIVDLNRISGQLAGAQFSYAYLKAQLDALGVSAAQQHLILDPFLKLLVQYQAKLYELTGGRQGAVGDIQPRSHAEGGLIDLRNSNYNPSGNIRWGEAGSEGGVRLSDDQLFVLNNRIMSAIRDQSGAGTVNLPPVHWQSSGDFYRDRFAIRKMIREEVREALH